MKNLFKVVTVFATLALLVGTMVALSVSAAVGDPGATNPSATGTDVTAVATETGATQIVSGDANGDGRVNMLDVLFVRRYLADIKVDINLDSADTNNDGIVNTEDLLNLRKFMADLILTLPVPAAAPTATAA